MNGRSEDKLWGLLPMTPEDEAIPAYMNVFYPEYHRSGTAESRTREDEYPGYFTRTPLGQCDVVLSDCTAESLAAYRTIIAVGPLTIDAGLADALIPFVENGGTLLLTAEQLRNGPETLRNVFGIEGISEPDQTGHIIQAADLSILPLVGDGTQTDLVRFIGHSFRYNRLALDGAAALARCGDDTIAAANRHGKGLAVVTAVHSLVDGRQGQRALRFERELIARLVARRATARQIDAGDISWALNQTDGNLKLLIINHGKHEWCGRIEVDGPYRKATAAWQTREGCAVSGDAGDGRLAVCCTVPPNGILIAALT